MRTALQVVERNLGDEDAAAVLAEIAAGRLRLCLLPWIPLLHGGGEAAIIQQWLELAGRETDSRRRSDYGGLALVFAEAAVGRKEWQEALKGWNVVESQQVLEWIAEGEAKGEIKGETNALLAVLASRFSPGAPAEVAAAIRAVQDLERLRNWIHAAATAASLDAFRQAAGL